MVRLGMMVLAVASACAASAMAAPGDAFIGCKYGLFAHYMYGNYWQRSPHSVEELNARADEFNAEEFGKDMETFGVQYVIFTLWHVNMNPLFPSEVMERYRPGHCSRRDVAADLIAQLKPRGIKFIPYVNCRSLLNEMHDSDKVKIGIIDPTPERNPTKFLVELFTELGERYGTGIDGYWWDHAPGCEGCEIDTDSLRRVIRSYNPDIVITGTCGGSFCDHSSSEDFGEYAAPMEEWPARRVLSTAIAGGGWRGSCPTGVAKMDADPMKKYLILSAGVSEAGGVAFAATPCGGDGRWEIDVEENLTAVGEYLRPVSRSIFDTRPSRAYFLLSDYWTSQVTLQEISWGVATESLDGLMTYLHILKTPDARSITIPPPMNGALFDEAEVVRSENRAGLWQDPSGITVTLGEDDVWDTLSTQIALRRIPFHLHTEDDPTRVFVVFAEPVDSLSAVNREHYAFDGGVSVTGVEIAEGCRSAVLTVSALSEDDPHTLAVNGVRFVKSLQPMHGATAVVVHRRSGRLLVDWGGEYTDATVPLRGRVDEFPVDLGGPGNNSEADDGRYHIAPRFDRPMSPDGRGGYRGVSDRFYGAALVMAVDRWQDHIALEVLDGGSDDAIRIGTTNPHEGKAWGLCLWKKEDFLNGAAQGETVGLGWGSALSAVMDEGDSCIVRFIVEDGQGFHISRAATYGGGGAFMLRNIPGQPWAAYRPGAPSDIALDPASAAFVIRSFDDIAGAGIYVEGRLSTIRRFSLLAGDGIAPPAVGTVAPATDALGALSTTRVRAAPGHLTIQSGATGMRSVRIYRADGRCAESCSWWSRGPDRFASRPLSKGMYVVRVVDHAGRITTRRVALSR